MIDSFNQIQMFYESEIKMLTDEFQEERIEI